jgi:hypothetical protein
LSLTGEARKLTTTMTTTRTLQAKLRSVHWNQTTANEVSAVVAAVEVREV